MEGLSFQVEQPQNVPKGVIVVLSGSIDAKTVPGFQEQLGKVKDTGAVKFIIDMEQVRYVNSTGLGYLVNLADSLDPAGGGIALVKLQPKVKVVFDLLGLNAFFKSFDSRQAAVQHFSGAGAPAAAKPASAPAAAARPASAPVAARPVAVAAEASGSSSALMAAGRSSLATPTTTASTGASSSGIRPAVPTKSGSSTSAPALSTATAVQTAVGLTIECLTCKCSLLVGQPGNYKCPRCSSLFTYQAEGKANFLPRKRPPPIQMTLTGGPECIEGLCVFARRLAAKSGFPDDLAKIVEDAVRESATAITKVAYGASEHCTYQVLIAISDHEISVRFADYGRQLDAAMRDTQGREIFGFSRKNMDVFDLKPHPRGGNILTLSKRLS